MEDNQVSAACRQLFTLESQQLVHKQDVSRVLSTASHITVKKADSL
ncbi:MAG TPA: hypothetical protein V6C95_08855 [Coleofasciculaceae cyanobacterium]